MLKKNFENGTTFVFAGCSTVYHLAKADRKRKETLTSEENYCTPISVHVFPVKNEKLFKEWKSALSIMNLNVDPDDATLLLGTRDCVPMDPCFTLSQGVASPANNASSGPTFTHIKKN